MKKYGHQSPKRSSLWANTREVGIFATGKLKLKKGDRSLLVHQYVDSSGRKRFVGKKMAMKRSGTFVCMVYLTILFLSYLFGGLKFKRNKGISKPVLVLNSIPKIYTYIDHEQRPSLRRYPLGFGVKYVKVFDTLRKNPGLKQPNYVPEAWGGNLFLDSVLFEPQRAISINIKFLGWRQAGNLPCRI